jgi:hypothetical protein
MKSVLFTESMEKEPDKSPVLELIGRHNPEKNGKPVWISENEWILKQDEIMNEQQLSKFALRLDDSDKKRKCIITYQNLVQAIEQNIPSTHFKTVPGGISIEEPYLPLFSYWDNIRTAINSNGAEEKPLELSALEHFLYEGKPQYRSLEDPSATGLAAVVNFETLRVLFKPGEELVVIDKFNEKRLFKHTHIEENLGEVGMHGQLCISLYICGWCVIWDREQKRFTHKSCNFKINRFSGHRRVESLPIYPLRCENKTTLPITKENLKERGRRWAELISLTSSYHQYNGLAREIARPGKKEFIQVSSHIFEPNE